jgi:hypothetical protein
MPKFRFRSSITGRFIKACIAKLLPWFAVRERCGPTIAELRAQAEDAMREPEGIDLGPLSHEERNRILFGGKS